jgi:hypothetical protein
LCIHARIENEKQSGVLRMIVDVVYANNRGEKGACNGEKVNSLILNLGQEYSQHPQSVEQCVSRIQEKYAGVLKITAMKKGDGTYLIAILENSDFSYREYALRDLLVEESSCVYGEENIVLRKDMFEYNQVMVHVGTPLVIREGVFSGF